MLKDEQSIWLILGKISSIEDYKQNVINVEMTSFNINEEAQN